MVSFVNDQISEFARVEPAQIPVHRLECTQYNLRVGFKCATAKEGCCSCRPKFDESFLCLFRKLLAVSQIKGSQPESAGVSHRNMCFAGTGGMSE